MEIYEYLMAAIIAVLILVASSTMVFTLTDPISSSSQKEQLKVTAEKLMTQFLLDPGMPYDWGSKKVDYNLLTSFGLAKYGGTSREAYDLDPDKVQRLNFGLEFETPDFYVKPQFSAELLNINNDYGFTFELNATLNVDIATTPLSSTESFSINVKSDYAQMPISNAKITASLYYLEGGTIKKSGPLTTQTDYVGECVIDFEFTAPNNMKALIVVADYLGLQVTKVMLPQDSGATTSYLLGNELISTNEIQLQGEALEVIAPREAGSYTIKDFVIGYSRPELNYVLDYHPEESVVAILGVIEGNPQGLLVAFRDYEISYRTTRAVRSASSAYSLERIVRIGVSTYTATLYLWRGSY